MNLQKEASQEIMCYLIDTPYILLKKEVEEMTQEEAHKVWNKISINWTYVCRRAGGRGKVAQAWTSLLRKMTLIQRRAEAPG